MPVAEQQSLLRPMAGDVVAERAQAFARGLADQPAAVARPRRPAAPPARPPAPAPHEPAPAAPAAPAAPEAVQAPPPAPDEAPADERPPTELPPRNYAAAREAIRTACGRLVIREYVCEPPPASAPSGSTPTLRGFHLYQLFEPVLTGANYSETKTDRAGRAWGLARTRRPATPLADYDAQVEHQLAQARRAVLVMRATVEELSLRDAHGRPGGVAEGIYEARGDVILLTDPSAAARRFRDQRGAR